MKRELNALVVDALHGEIAVLPLRGADEFARTGGDMDFMVPPGQAITACRLVAQAASKQGWLLALFRDIGYLAQIVLIRPSQTGSDQAIKVDFFDGLRWYGVGHDRAGQEIFQIFSNADGDHSRVCAAAGFFQKVLIVGQVSERDWARVVAMGADVDYLASTAQQLGLPLSAAQISQHGVSGYAKWYFRAASGGAISPLKRLVWLPAVLVAHAKFHMGIGTGAGMLLGVSGLDGSGKSTLVNRLQAAFIQAGGAQPSLVHLLPAWIPLPHQLFRRHKTASNYTKPYSEPPVTSRLNGGLRLAYYFVAFCVSKIALRVMAARGRQVILDRSLLDFASDPTRSRIPLRKLPQWLLRCLLPKGLWFFLNASPAVVVARKGELTLEKATSLQASYLEACASVDAQLLNGDNASDVVFRELLETISQEYLLRIEHAELRG